MSKTRQEELWDKAKPVMVDHIADRQISEMSSIAPLLEVAGGWEVVDVSQLDPRNVSCIWDPPIARFLKGPFSPLNKVDIMTFHTWGAPSLFKPSLAEVYSCIIRALPESWRHVRYFSFPGTLDANNVVGDFHAARCRLYGEHWEIPELNAVT